MTINLTLSSYTKLLAKLQKEISIGLENAQKAYNKEKIITYWKVGQTIQKHLLAHKRADYGRKLFHKLANDLNISQPLLYKIVDFYKKYPSLPQNTNLKWSHYQLLSSIKNQEKREELEAKASSENWSHRTLQKNVEEEKEEYLEYLPVKKKKRKKLSFARGKLFTYKIFKANYTNEMLVDLGFNTYKETSLKNFKGKFVEAIKIGDEYKFKSVDAKRKHLYTYKAYVEKIIDGDTLWVNIDCGFKIWLRQKLRLRGIDTPDIENKEGKQALRFVRSCIEREKFIIIKSHGRDKYDRHLVDLFYKGNEQDPQTVLLKGNFLNQELLDEGLAEIV